MVNVLDRELSIQAAVEAPRLHVEEGVVYVEPGVDTSQIEHSGRGIARFADRNLFFGGVHAVQRDPVDGTLSGGGDSRRGGAVAVA